MDFVVIALIVIIWYIFGNSPTLEEALLVLVLTVLYGVSIKMSNLGARLNLIEKRFNNMEKSFIKLVNDFKSIKKR